MRESPKPRHCNALRLILQGTRWGLLLVTVKPQVGAGVALFWFVEAWRIGGVREVVRVFAPVTLIVLVSFVIFGLWPTRFVGTVEYSSGAFNASLWPWSIPVGFALLTAAIRRRDMRPAMAAAPCLAPHVVFHSWIVALAAMVKLDVELIAAVVGLWVLVVIRAVTGAV